MTPVCTSQTIWACWEWYAREHPEQEAAVYWDALDKPFRWTYAALFREASNIAGKLISRGVKSGDICALILRHNKIFHPLYMGIVAAGAVPAVLAYPNPRLHPDKFTFGLAGIARTSGLDWVLTERELEPVIKPLVMSEHGSIRGMLFPLEWAGGNQDGEPDCAQIKERQSMINGSMPLLLQFSSGTTGLQKGVVLSHKAVLDHIRRYSGAISLTPRDKIASWLPLYHDMGLITSFHMPLVGGIPVIQIDPFQWVSAPVILFQAISAENAALTWLPNFAYNFMSDRISDDEMEGVDLSCMRMFINCSEVVRAGSHEKFLRRFGKYGVTPGSLSACYAMAETVYAVTQGEPGRGSSSLSLERESFSKGMVNISGNVGSRKICVSSGRPVPGSAVRITDKEGRELPDDTIGMVMIRSESLFTGYRNNSQKTARAFEDGWYISGDIGFCHEGEYYILGREDDMIIVAGNNICPEDIEDAVNAVPGVAPGRVVAFGIDDPENGTQEVCVIAETLCTSGAQQESLRLAIMRAGMSIDVTIATVHLVAPRWLIKSSSGKLSRKANKRRFLQGMAVTCGESV